MPPKKILIVDDDTNLLTILEKRLVASGYEVVVARDGAEALTMVGAQMPDLIVMDVIMPKMTGYEVLEKIRGVDSLRKIPAIIISAKGSMRDFFADLSGVEFMTKPYEIKALLAKIERLLWESEGQDQDGSKRVVLLGAQEALIDKIQAAIGELGYQAFVALNEEDALNLAKQVNAANVLCQFWEDENILNAPKLKEKLNGHPLLSEVSLYVYCDDRLSSEAMRSFSDGRLIIYRDESDLLDKVVELFKE
jgi:CheY-like chemotaxis protein